MSRAVLCVVALMAVAVFAAESTGRATLLVHKKLTGDRVFLPANQYQLDERQKERGVELFANGRNFTVEVALYNIGDAAAFDVTVEDAWPEAQFTVLSGDKSAKFESIPAGGVKWLNQSLVPTFDGEFQGFEATVTYKAAEKDEDSITAKSTPMRDITFLDEALFEKVTAKHTREWTLFSMLIVLSVAVPALFYTLLQLQFNNGVPRKSKSA